MGVVHHLADVDNEVGLTQSQYCYARRAHMTPMPLVPKSLIGCQKCDSGSHHCLRYTGEFNQPPLLGLLSWVWEHVQELLQ